MTTRKRLDENCAHLHRALIACQTGKVPPIEELRLEYDWKRCFPKDLEDILEEMAANADAEMENIINRFRGRRQTADGS